MHTNILSNFIDNTQKTGNNPNVQQNNFRVKTIQ